MGKELGYPAFPSVQFVCHHHSGRIGRLHKGRPVTGRSFDGQLDPFAQWPNPVLERCKNRYICYNGFIGTVRLTCMFHEGTAGYGNTSFTIGQSYADQPILAPIIFNANAPAGQQWSRDGLSPSTVPRMYHSSVTLLPDGKSQYTLQHPSDLIQLVLFVVQALSLSLDLIRTLITTSRQPIQRNIAWRHSIQLITTSEGRNRRDFRANLLMEEHISTYHYQKTIYSGICSMPKMRVWLSSALGSQRTLW